VTGLGGAAAHEPGRTLDRSARLAARSRASKKAAATRARLAALNPRRLTRRQRELLFFIRDFVARTERNPSRAEIGAAMGHASHGVTLTMLAVLQDAQLVERISTYPSTYRPTVLREAPVAPLI
jgi:LexA DNA binding domain-containing protein